MSIAGLRAAVIADLEANVSGFQVFGGYGGTFNRDELKRIALKSPACLVSVLGGTVQREGGEPTCNLTMSAFIITRGTSQQLRDEDVLVLVEPVAARVARNGWKYECSRAPEGVRIDNLYTGEIDKLGVALWSVTWIQRLDIDVFDPDAEPLADFHTLYFDTDLAPRDGVIEAEGLVVLGGEFMSAYGQAHIDTPSATAIATADTYVKASGSTTLKLADDVDMPVDNRLRHTGPVAKPFLATASFSVTVDQDAKVTLCFAKGGTPDTDSEVEQEITVAGGAEAFSLKHIVSLDQNEYIEVWVKSDAGPMGVTLTKANVVLAAT